MSPKIISIMVFTFSPVVLTSLISLTPFSLVTIGGPEKQQIMVKAIRYLLQPNQNDSLSIYVCKKS